MMVVVQFPGKSSMARLGRRHFLTIALFGALLRTGRDSKADEPEISFVSWINTLYVGELARREAAEAGAGAEFSNEELQALFSPEVQAMRDAAKDRIPPTEPEAARSCTSCSAGVPCRAAKSRSFRSPPMATAGQGWGSRSTATFGRWS